MVSELGQSIQKTDLLGVENLRKEFEPRKQLRGGEQHVVALDGVNLELKRGTFLGLIGRSGCGKSTLAKCLAGVERPTSGSIWFDGVDLASHSASERREWHAQVQIVYQDSANSFNPRFTGEEIVREPLDIQKKAGFVTRSVAARQLIERVGLPQAVASRKAGELSGGQRQRLAIGRALALEPELLILDESFSALDLWNQLQIARLISRLRAEQGITCISIAHNFSLLSRMSDEIAVMESGRIIEQTTPAELLRNPRNPNTRELVGSFPRLDHVCEVVA